MAVTSKFEDGNFKAAVRLLCSDDTIASNNISTLSALQQKHPTAPSDRKMPNDPSEPRFTPLQIDITDVRKALQTFPAGSSGGPDGITPQHLKDLMTDKTDNKLTVALRDFVNKQLAGEFPAEMNEILYGGRLMALQKKDGGIRPIAIGYTWRRWWRNLRINTSSKMFQAPLPTAGRSLCFRRSERCGSRNAVIC